MKKPRKEPITHLHRGGFPSLTANLLADLKKAIETGDTAKLEKMAQREKQEEFAL